MLLTRPALATAARGFAVQLRRGNSSLAKHAHPRLFKFLPQVQSALAAKSARPVVALESTIITHGMPYPQNLETALAVEEVVRSEGCVPATIAIIRGNVHVGLSHSEVEYLAKTGLKAKKTSRRDLPFVLAEKLDGSTTVSATSFLANKAGIKLFATGGIGGVHRGVAETMDISADLTELGRTPVAVVCAGVKSILDIEKTLEFLETQGVTVATLGLGRDFPAFYVPSSGVKSPMNVADARAAAEMIFANDALNLGSGSVIAVPVPETFCDTGALQAAIMQALQEAGALGIKGHETTPFLLGRVKELTHGKSLEANIALIKHNARVASQVAKEYHALVHKKTSVVNNFSKKPSVSGTSIIFGGAVVDITSKYSLPAKFVSQTSNPGTCFQHLGGVGRNVAEACFRSGETGAEFVSVVGEDFLGRLLKEEMEAVGMDTSLITTRPKGSTAVYNAILDNDGNLMTAVANMSIFDSMRLEEATEEFMQKSKVNMAVVDGNVPSDLMHEILKACDKNNVPVLYEPTSVYKSTKMLKVLSETGRKSSGTRHRVAFATPDYHEMKEMGEWIIQHSRNAAIDVFCVVARIEDDHRQWFAALPDDLRAILRNFGEDIVALLFFIPTLVIKIGKHGVLLARLFDQGEQCPRDHICVAFKSAADGREKYISLRHFAPTEVVAEPVSVTGAGDSLVGTFVAAVSHGLSIDDAVRAGMHSSLLSLQTLRAVSEEIRPLVASKEKP